MSDEETILYQFPISHYCEKARWALDLKGLPYRLSNMAPGLHMLQTRKMGVAGSSLPILRHRGEFLQGSDNIVDYLDREIPRSRLTPADPQAAAEAREWEKFLDHEIGVQLRRYFYHYILARPTLAKRMILHQAPASTKLAFSLAFPLIRKFMRKGMNIRPETAEKSRQKLEQAFARMNDLLAKRPYLVGDAFSRADLSAAALLAPLCRPPEHSFPFPGLDETPEPLRKFAEQHQDDPFFRWTLKMYREHRA